MTLNDQMLEAVKSRGQKRAEFGHGIITADRYVRTLLEHVGSDVCYRAAADRHVSFNDILTKAASTLVYSNEDMLLEEVEYEKTVAGVRKLGKDVELPKNTLMAFRHVLTTPRKDRDGDILRTQGAEVDTKMPLLWQHIPTMPIGKLLKVVKQNSKTLTVLSAIVDVNETCHDAAVMIDNKMGRFSHGFRPLEYEPFKSNDGEDEGGFDVKSFEIMEESLVSVPSNVDAETEEVMLSLIEGEKLTSPVMKEYGKTIRGRRPAAVPVGIDLRITVNDQEIKNENKPGTGGKKAGDEGRSGGSSEEADAAAKKAKAAEDAEVKRPYGNDFNGSWEWITEKLRYKVKRYLLANGVSVGEDDWTYLVATYSDYAVMAFERRVTEDIEYYQVGWKMTDEEPEFDGEPKKVDVKISVEILEQAKSLTPESAKPYPNEHACRLRPPGNFQEGSFRRTTRKHDGKSYSIIMGRLEGETTMTEQAYRYPKGTWEAGDARSHCTGHKGKFEAASEESVDTVEPKSITVEDAMKVVLTCATRSQRDKLRKTLDALAEAEQSDEITKQYRALIGANE